MSFSIVYPYKIKIFSWKHYENGNYASVLRCYKKSNCLVSGRTIYRTFSIRRISQRAMLRKADDEQGQEIVEKLGQAIKDGDMIPALIAKMALPPGAIDLMMSEVHTYVVFN